MSVLAEQPRELAEARLLAAEIAACVDPSDPGLATDVLTWRRALERLAERPIIACSRPPRL